MSQTERPQAEQGFEFTEKERLFYRLSDKRFRVLFEDEQTSIHKIELSSNSYGQFLFVTLSHQGERRRAPITLYGYGYHEYRERWLHGEWFYYQANQHPSTTSRTVPKDEARDRLNQRRDEIAPYIKRQTQSRRGQLFEMIADLTDDDGAIGEMEDLGDLFDDLE